MDRNIPAMKNLARWLLAHEAAQVKPEETVQGPVCVHVCEKLRRPLSLLAGVDGYKSLITRALALARADAHTLNLMQVMEDGALEVPGPAELQQEAAKGGAALVAQLLGLLATFIGEALTMQLVRDVWPDAPFEGIDSNMEKS